MTTEVQSAAAGRCCGLEGPHPHDEPPAGGDRERLSRMAGVFKALADETRLRILRAMMRSPQVCECEIVPLFGLSQPTISYHLKVLREAGIVETERRGRWLYYRLAPRALLGVVRDLAELD